MKHSKAIAHLRQLCCLGLGKDILIPEFLKAVQTVIPSGSNLITFVDGCGFHVSAIHEWHCPNEMEMAFKFLPSIHTPANVKLFQETYQRDHVVTDATYAEIKFYSSDFYHVVWLPMEQHFFIQAPILIDRQVVGQLWLFRSRDHKPFTVTEQKQCIQLMSYVSHALAEPPDVHFDYISTGNSSLVVANSQGDILYMGEQTHRLLALATQLDSYRRGQSHKVNLPPPLVNLCRTLDKIFKEKDTQPPVLTHTNAAGRFVFRGYWLDKLNNEPGGLIGITIEHQEPTKLHLLRNLQKHQFSATQVGVALLLAQCKSHETICQHLHIKPTTLKDHIGKVYSRLNVHNRDEMLTRLLNNSVHI